MKRFLLLLLALSATGAAMAQAPNENTKARELATRLGKERSVEGLESILQSRNNELFAVYVQAFNTGAQRRPMEPAIEALMLRYESDPAWGSRLPALCGSSGVRCQTQELFDRMLSRLRAANPRGSDLQDLRMAVLASDAPKASEALTAWLQAPDAPIPELARQVMQSLGVRKYAPAAAAIGTLAANAPKDYASSARFALEQIGTPEAAQALLANLARLKGAPATAETRNQQRELLQALMRLPVTIAIPYRSVKAALPADLREGAIHWLGQRKDLDAGPDVLVLLPEPAQYAAALHAIIASDSLDLQRQARAIVEGEYKAGRMQQGQYTYASAELDRRVVDPGNFRAEEAFTARLGELGREKVEAGKLLASNAEQYVAAMRKYVSAMEKLLADNAQRPLAPFERGQLSLAYLDLAHAVRFRLKQPREALELYEAARRNGSDIGAFAAADTWQFDLKDTKRALVEYRKLVTPMPPKAPPGMDFPTLRRDTWAQRWLAAQIAYLESGKTFSGALIAEDLSVGDFIENRSVTIDVFGLSTVQQKAFQGAQSGSIDRKEIERALAALPSSAVALLHSVWLVSMLPDSPAILAHLKRHDPAGYASATYFALLDRVTRDGNAVGMFMLAPGIAPGIAKDTGTNPVREASARFLREHRIDTKTVDGSQRKPVVR